MGEVYEALDDVLGREVAIKTLRGSSGLAARFIDERFRNEARAIAQLAHPGVVQVFDIDLTADPPYLVMERVAGPALSDRLDDGPLPADQIVPLGIQIARALAAAHAAAVIHRDVKPSNILGAGPGMWKLADFGVAHVPDSSLTMTGQFVGSPAYAAPEALIKGISNAAGDIYGLGATLYEAAAGTWPRLEANGALLAPVPPIAERVHGLPPHVAAAIDRAVSLDASQRPTASELADLLAGAATQTHAVHAVPIGAVSYGGHATNAGHPGQATHAGHGVPAVSMTSIGDARPPRGPLRWQPWAIAGAVVVAIVLVVALRGDGKKPSMPGAGPLLPSAAGAKHDDTQDELSPEDLQFQLPGSVERAQARHWQKLGEALQEGNFDKARERIDELEKKFGATDDTERLRAQIERVQRHMPRSHDD